MEETGDYPRGKKRVANLLKSKKLSLDSEINSE